MAVRMRMEWHGSIGEIARRATGGDGARVFMAETAKTLMEPFVPMDTGALAGSASAFAGGVSYGAGYAAYNYYGDGKQFRQDKHPLASAYWDRAMMEVCGDELVRLVDGYIRG